MKINSRLKYGFSFYDFSNSGYVLIFQSFLFPLFFVKVLSNYTDTVSSLWSWSLAISVFLSIILAPLIGKFADQTNKSLPFTILVIIVGTLAFLSPFFIEINSLLFILVFVIFNASFELTQSLYNAFLPEICETTSERTKLSTFAWGFGYLGGITFAIVYFILNKIGLNNGIILSITAGMYILFSIFPIKVFSEIENKVKLKSAIEQLKNLNVLFKLKLPMGIGTLLVYWIIATCVTAMMFFSTLYAKTELHISETAIGVLLIGTQLLAFPMTWLSGPLAEKFGLLKILKISLFIWFLVLIILYFSQSLIHLIFAMLFTSLVIGSTQSLARAHFANIVNKSNAGESFGFFGVVNKSASLIAPIIVGISIEITGNIRPAFLVLSILILIAIVFLKLLKKEDNL